MWPDSKDIMYMPININNNHWILSVVNKRKRTIDVYDSLNHKNTREIRLVCKKLDMVLNNTDPWVANDR